MNNIISKGRSSKIEPGCEIIVPIKPERTGVSLGDVIERLLRPVACFDDCYYFVEYFAHKPTKVIKNKAWKRKYRNSNLWKKNP